MNYEEKNFERPNHNIVMESRSKMMITGVRHVENFDENSVVLDTNMGMLSIKGNSLKVDKLNVDSGELNIHGTVVGLVYSDETKNGGLLSRLFK